MFPVVGASTPGENLIVDSSGHPETNSSTIWGFSNAYFPRTQKAFLVNSGGVKLPFVPENLTLSTPSVSRFVNDDVIDVDIEGEFPGSLFRLDTKISPEINSETAEELDQFDRGFGNPYTHSTPQGRSFHSRNNPQAEEYRLNALLQSGNSELAGIGSQRDRFPERQWNQDVDVNAKGAPAAFRHLSRVTLRAGSGYVVDHGRPFTQENRTGEDTWEELGVTAQQLFRVNVSHLWDISLESGVHSNFSAFTFKESIAFLNSVAATFAWKWSSQRVTSTRQVDTAPEAVLETMLYGLEVGGYPAGGLPWAHPIGNEWKYTQGRKRVVGDSQRPYRTPSFSSLGLGGQLFEYGPVEFDVSTHAMIYRVVEYAGGLPKNASLKSVRSYVSHQEESSHFEAQNLEFFYALDGGQLQQRYMGIPRVNNYTDAEVRPTVPKKIKKGFLSLSVKKVDDEDLIAETIHNLNDNLVKKRVTDAAMYANLIISSLMNPNAYGMIQTCRSDAGFPFCEQNEGRNLMETLMDTHCYGVDSEARLPRCVLNITIPAVQRTIVRRSGDGFQATKYVVQPETNAYSGQCHYSHSLCFRGLRPEGGSFYSSRCDLTPGSPCWSSRADIGGMWLGTQGPFPAYGFPDPITGRIRCFLGQGGPNCQYSCGDRHDELNIGRERDFPHYLCRMNESSSCVFVGNEDATIPRVEGCHDHGYCFTDGDPTRCQCFANVGGDFCDKCKPGFFGYRQKRSRVNQAPNWHDVTGNSPYAEIARLNSTLLSDNVLYPGNPSLWNSGDGVGGEDDDDESAYSPYIGAPSVRRRLSGPRGLSEVDIVSTDVDEEVLASRGAIIGGRGAGAIITPPETHENGCSGSCWSFQPKDVELDLEVPETVETYGQTLLAWDPDASSGRFSLVESCPLIWEEVGLDKLQEISSRCGLEFATSESDWLSVVSFCPVDGPNGTRSHVMLPEVCDFGEDVCEESPMFEALSLKLGITPATLFGCPETPSHVSQGAGVEPETRLGFSWDDAYSVLAGGTLFPVLNFDEDLASSEESCQILRSGNHSVFSRADILIPGGWAAQLHTVAASPLCQETRNTSNVPVVTSPNNTIDGDSIVPSFNIDSATGRQIWVDDPCEKVGFGHINIDIGLSGVWSSGRIPEGSEPWRDCPILCDPLTFYERNGFGWDESVPVEKRRRSGVTPIAWLGCPSGLTTESESGSDGFLDEELQRSLVRKRWLSDWKQCDPGVFYSITEGEARKYHMGTFDGDIPTTEVLTLEFLNETLPKSWTVEHKASAAAFFPAANLSYFRALDAESDIDIDIDQCVYHSDDHSAFPFGWECPRSEYTSTCFRVFGGSECISIPRPAFQQLIGITPQAVLGCPTTLLPESLDVESGKTTQNTYLDILRDNVNSSRPVGRTYAYEGANLDVHEHPCDPDVFYSLNFMNLSSPNGTTIPQRSDPATIVRVCQSRNSQFVRSPRNTDSGIVLGKICGGPRRAATCDLFLDPDSECADRFPPCQDGSRLACKCHNLSGCECRAGSNLDPTQNCISCLPGFTWVEDGNFDTCVLSDGCVPDETRTEYCSGHGECIFRGTRELTGDIQYANASFGGAYPLSFEDGFVDITSSCVCSSGWRGDYCDVEFGIPLSRTDSGNDSLCEGLQTSNVAANIGLDGTSCFGVSPAPFEREGGCQQNGLVFVGRDSFYRTQQDSIKWYYSLFAGEADASAVSEVCVLNGGRGATYADYLKASAYSQTIARRRYDTLKSLYDDSGEYAEGGDLSEGPYPAITLARVFMVPQTELQLVPDTQVFSVSLEGTLEVFERRHETHLRTIMMANLCVVDTCAGRPADGYDWIL